MDKAQTSETWPLPFPFKKKKKHPPKVVLILLKRFKNAARSWWNKESKIGEKGDYKRLATLLPPLALRALSHKSGVPEVHLKWGDFKFF